MYSSANLSNMKMAPYKKKLCQRWENSGICSIGNDCTYAHGVRDLRTFENPLYKAQVCTAFEQSGMCNLADDCLFAHGEEELRLDDVPPIGGNTATVESQDSNPPLPMPLATRVSVKQIAKGPSSFKTALCIHFTKNGTCSMGDTCSFAHGREELQKSSEPDPSDPKYKTRLCIRFAQDQFCPNGDMCLFAHGETELRDRAEEEGMGIEKKNSLYKTTLCHNYATLGGVCPAGKNCQFAHGQFEIRPVGFNGDFDAKVKENPKWKCVMCKLYQQTGQCPRVNCDYAHGPQELRVEHQTAPNSVKPNYKTVMCNRFITEGFCHLGEACTFAHGELELRKIGGIPPQLSQATSTTRAGSGLRKRLGPTPLPFAAPTSMVATNGGTSPLNANMSNQQLFSEFLEFKKFKEHAEASRASAAMRSTRLAVPSLMRDSTSARTGQLSFDPATLFARAAADVNRGIPAGVHKLSAPPPPTSMDFY